MATLAKSLTPRQFIDSLEEPRRSEIRKLDKLIRETMPDLKPVLTGEMLGYGPFRYRYKTGREGDMCDICLCSKKNYISLHVFGANNYKKKIGKADVGVACIRFKSLDDLNVDVLKEILRNAPKVRNFIERK